MSKELVSFLTGFIFLSALSLCPAKSLAQEQPAPDKLPGYWQGDFMPGNNLTLFLHFFNDDKGNMAGRVWLFQGRTQIQDDPLSRITLRRQQLSFLIEAKDTPFDGEIDITNQVIRGHFRFPDGSRQPVLVKKTDTPSFIHPSISAKDPYTRYAPGQLQEDLRFLHTKLETTHPQLYLYSSKAELDHSFDETLTQLDESMTEDAFFRLLAPLVANVRCSHTVIRFSDAFSKALNDQPVFLPLKVRVLKDKLYVIENDCCEDVSPGSEIVSINGQPVSELLPQMLAGLPADAWDLPAKRFIMNRDFAATYLQTIETAREFEIEVMTPPGEMMVLTLPGTVRTHLPNRETNSHANQFSRPPARFEILEKPNLALLTISEFMAPDWQQLFGLFESSFATLKQQGIRNLILDVRGVMGGHPLIAAELLSYLVDSNYVYFAKPDDKGEFVPLYEPQAPKPNAFAGNLYVLMNGGCLSTTGHFLSLVKYHELGTLVGEEAGGSFYCNDRSMQVTLPNTGIQVNIPQTTFETAVRGFRKGDPLLPDYEVHATLQDILNHVDVDMVFVRDLIQKRREQGPIGSF